MASSASATTSSQQRRRVGVQNVLTILDCDDSDVEGYVDDSDGDEDWDMPANQAEQQDDGGDDSEDSECDVPLANLVPLEEDASAYRWRKQRFTPRDSSFLGAELSPPADMSMKTPLQYFQLFITNEMIDSVVENTNLYSVQKDARSLDTTRKEIEQVLGMYFHMGLVKMGGVRQYWETDTAFHPVCSVMARNRFQTLLRNLHFVDNMSITDEQKRDKIWKVRPWVDAIRENCLKIVPEEHLSIDEMMCTYYGQTSPIRQYLSSKPHPWGFKIWCRAGPSGILYDFEVYQGGDGARTELGLGADVVLRLIATLPDHRNYKIYADNLFTGLPLISELNKKGVFYTGTVRQNRMKGCDLKDDKSMKKEGRGSVDWNVERNRNIVAVRWYDNKAVTLLSTLSGLEPMSEAQRWDKKKKEKVSVPMPAVIADYNKNMGGVDLLDSFLARHKFLVKSRRWYIYLFWHFVTVSLVNAWNVYRRDYRLLDLPEQKILSRRKFQAIVASSLVAVNTKRGRPLAGGDGTPKPPRKMRRDPCQDVRYDGMCHWPMKLEKRGRCKVCEKNNTNTACTKCDVRLCFVKERNCFVRYHHQ